MEYCDSCGPELSKVKSVGRCEVCGADGPMQGRRSSDRTFFPSGFVVNGRYQVYALQIGAAKRSNRSDG